jgi:hypothetical protein
MDKIEQTIRNLETQHAKCSDSIDEYMFDNTDVEQVEICNNHIFVVKFKNINGTLPSSFFTQEARDKLLKIAKLRNSQLWKALND